MGLTASFTYLAGRPHAETSHRSRAQDCSQNGNIPHSNHVVSLVGAFRILNTLVVGSISFLSSPFSDLLRYTCTAAVPLGLAACASFRRCNPQGAITKLWDIDGQGGSRCWSSVAIVLTHALRHKVLEREGAPKSLGPSISPAGKAHKAHTLPAIPPVVLPY